MKNLEKYLSEFKGNKVLAVIFPHPDDETVATGGLLMIARKYGYRVVVIILTKGERGQMLINPMGKTTSEIRERELRLAVKRLGGDELIQMDFPDAGLKETVSKWKNEIDRQLGEINPGIVVTYDPSGMTGHPDHISLSLVMKELAKKRKIALFWTTMPEKIKEKVIPKSVWESVTVPTDYLNLGIILSVRKWWAVRAYRSQPMFSHFWPVPLIFLFLYVRSEWYHLVELDRKYQYKYIDFKV
jgi:LmbE family N-acetylglucosaminyl deacetylase